MKFISISCYGFCNIVIFQIFTDGVKLINCTSVILLNNFLGCFVYTRNIH